MREYAVDPSWLTTGVYDPSRRRQALQDDATISRVLLQTIPSLSHSSATTARPSIDADTHSAETHAAVTAAAQKVDTRTRSIEADGLRWKVRELEWALGDRRSGTCLIFDGEIFVRTVRNFPPEWHDLPDAELFALTCGRSE